MFIDSRLYHIILCCFSNLDETTRAVYKENVRLNEALAYHLEDNVHLKKHIELLQAENDTLKTEKEVNNCTVREKVSNNKQLNRQVTEVHFDNKNFF